MQIKATSPEDYIDHLPPGRKEAVILLRNTILKNIPLGFEEVIGYGMIGYVVPHTIYPKGYHASPHLPLPFINLASQKNHIALYHMGLYSSREILEWFTDEYEKQTSHKPDMGKGCIRFKKEKDIPFGLIGQLVSKISVSNWIEMYENNRLS